MTCDLCDREVSSTTKHHLIPRARHNKSVKKKYKDECKNRLGEFCLACHRQVHYLFTHKELEKHFNTLESLRSDPDVQAYLEWIRKKPADFVPTKGKRKK